MLLEFTTPLVIASASARTISGRIVTFGEVGSTSAGLVRFERGSIGWRDMPTLNLEHNRAQPIGRAVQLSETPAGIDAVFRIAATNAGNDALVEASDGLRTGFSVGVEVSEHTYDGPVMVVNASQLNHVAHVVTPAIRSAVVTDVAASETEPESIPDPDDAPATPEAPVQEEETVVDTATVETPPVVDATAPLPPAPLAVASPARVQDPFPYGRPSVNASFFRDMHNARYDVEAAQRARVAQTMLIDAAMTSVIPPGYRPDLYVGELVQGTPVANACTRIPITDATSFSVPTFASATGMSADNVSGTNPASGTLNTSAVTVTPKAVSGIWDCPRELLDASNPGLDLIGMQAMYEEYLRDLESDVATAVVAGATAGIAGPTTKYTSSLIKNLAAYPFARFLPADQIVVGPTLFQELAGEEDTAGRAKNPYIGPQNAQGVLGTAAAALEVSGLAAVGAWSLPVQQGLILRKTDAAVFTSGPQTFRWEEVGPTFVRFAIWGYVGAAVLRAVGVVKYTQTA